MELRIIIIIVVLCCYCCCLTALQGLNPLEKPLEKRAISDYSSNTRHVDEVEGSGGSAGSAAPSSVAADAKRKNLVAADIEWEASGIGPDDEDGDVVEGSGSYDDDDDDDDVRGGGSGDVPPMRMPPIVTGLTSAATQTPYVNIHEIGRRPPEDDIRIEEESPGQGGSATTRITPSRESYPAMTTSYTSTPPNVFEGERHAPIDVLLKPGILAAVIGGIVVGILAAILLVMFVVYRMRKKDEGSYALDEPKQPPHYSYAYQKAPSKEFYA